MMTAKKFLLKHKFWQEDIKYLLYLAVLLYLQQEEAVLLELLWCYQLIISYMLEVLIVGFRPMKMVLGIFYSSSSDTESYLAQKISKSNI